MGTLLIEIGNYYQEFEPLQDPPNKLNEKYQKSDAI